MSRFTPRFASSLVPHEIELPAGRRVDFEDLEYAPAQIGERMGHAGGNVHHVVLADDVSLSIDDQRALAAFNDVDIVGVAVAMPLAARSAGHQPVEMHVELLGTETRIDQFDLFSPSCLHRSDRTL